MDTISKTFYLQDDWHSQEVLRFECSVYNRKVRHDAGETKQSKKNSVFEHTVPI